MKNRAPGKFEGGAGSPVREIPPRHLPRAEKIFIWGEVNELGFIYHLFLFCSLNFFFPSARCPARVQSGKGQKKETDSQDISDGVVDLVS
jgi:hypothetical protein